MIRCKLVEFTDPDDTQIGSRVGRAVSGETLSLGRAAACKIYLPDPRIRLEHASIHRAEDGYLYLEAAGPVFVDQRPQTSLRLVIGQKITVGPYDFVVEHVDDGPGLADSGLTLSFVHRASTHTGTDGQAAVRVGVVPGWITRRALVWMASLAVLVFAAWPVWHALQPAPPTHQAMLAPQAQPVAQAGWQAQALQWVNNHGKRLDVFWNPGQLSSAHQNLAQDCRSCHDKAFERVTDATCTSCHKTTGDHVKDPTISAHTVQGQRCASCHKEHQGQTGMRTADTVGCAQCHGNIRSYSALTTLGNVSDFATGHPAFRLSIRQPDAKTVLRTPQTAALRNDTGLIFPHDIHLDQQGIKSPTGPAATKGRVVLKCASCHTLDAAGVRFEPVRMASSCQSCHRLSVDPQAPEREVPHARPADVSVAVREIYASLAVDRFPVSLVTVNSLLQRPAGQAAPSQTTQAGRWVRQQSQAAFSAMFEGKNGVCKTCHVVHRESTPGRGQPAWQVQAVVATDHWLPQSLFSHAQHKNAECGTCHAAGKAKSAAAILLPDIGTCRTCHAGAKPEKDKVVSRCDSCHGFHPKQDHPVFQPKVAAAGGRP